MSDASKQDILSGLLAVLKKSTDEHQPATKQDVVEGLTKSLKSRVEAYTEKLVELRKMATADSLHPGPKLPGPPLPIKKGELCSTCKSEMCKCMKSDKKMKKAAPILPGSKKIKEIKAEGSGGEIKKQPLKKDDAGVPQAKPPTGTQPKPPSGNMTSKPIQQMKKTVKLPGTTRNTAIDSAHLDPGGREPLTPPKGLPSMKDKVQPPSAYERIVPQAQTPSGLELDTPKPPGQKVQLPGEKISQSPAAKLPMITPKTLSGKK